MDNKTLTIEDVEEIIEERLGNYQKEISSLKSEIDKLEDLIESHTHNGIDSKHVAGELRSKPGSYHDLDSGMLISLTSRPGVGKDITVLTAGQDKAKPGTKTGFSKNTELYLEKNESLNLIYAAGDTAYFNNSGSATITGSVISDNTFIWKESELVDNYINILDVSGNMVESRKVIANTSNTITLDSDPNTQGKTRYVINKGVLLGASNYPYRRLYVENDLFGGIRFGIGPTAGGKTSQLYVDGDNLKFKNASGTTTTIA